MTPEVSQWHKYNTIYFNAISQGNKSVSQWAKMMRDRQPGAQVLDMFDGIFRGVSHAKA